ncbi:MAG TPA: metallophosphoesterase, partial [Victivallales bacterium]|nr:metallophosphoesterase [Victivallales bacterium]
MRIFHFSDSHAGAPAEDWKAFLDKRWVGIFNYYFRRRFQHNQDILKKAVSVMLKESADLYICTGDITSTGQALEFKKAVDILSPLAETKRLIYLPGNHDFYVINNECNKALFNTFRYL